MCIHCDLYGFTMGRILLFILPKETSTISRYQQNETKKASFVSQIDFSEMKRNVWHETLKNVVNVVLWAVWPVVLFNNWPFEVLKWNFAQQLITFAKENSQFCKIQLKTRKQIPKWQNLAKSGHAGPQHLKALATYLLTRRFPVSPWTFAARNGTLASIQFSSPSCSWRQTLRSSNAQRCELARLTWKQR